MKICFIWPKEGVPVHIVVTHRSLYCTCILYIILKIGYCKSATLIYIISGRGRVVHLFKWGDYRKAKSVSIDRCHIFAE